MKLLAEKINVVEEESRALELIDKELLSPKVSVISFINAHAYTMADSSPEFKNCLLKSNLLFRDGSGAKILLRHYHIRTGYNANGTDLIPLVLDRYKDKSVCFIGTESPYIDEASATYKAKGTKLLAYMDGFQNTETMYNFVQEHQPEILILGMGMPKQEKFSLYMQENYKGSLLIINGGAIFDFTANRFTRAPAIFRKFGLEWFYRLINEPIRLFDRYVIGIPKFFVVLMRNAIQEKKASNN